MDKMTNDIQHTQDQPKNKQRIERDRKRKRENKTTKNTTEKTENTANSKAKQGEPRAEQSFMCTCVFLWLSVF